MRTFGLAFGLFCLAFGIVSILHTVRDYFFPALSEEDLRRIGEYELMAGNGLIRRMK